MESTSVPEPQSLALVLLALVLLALVPLALVLLGLGAAAGVHGRRRR